MCGTPQLDPGGDMKRRIVAVLAILLAVLPLVLACRCAGTRSEEVSSDPVLIQKEITQIDMEIQNTEELIKGTKAEIQVEDSQALREELRSLEMELIYLESRKRALEERLSELAGE